MGNSTEECQANSDRELWRAVRGDYYAPSVFVTSEGGIGMNHGGTVFVLTVEEWIKRAESFIRDDEVICTVDSIARLIQDDSWACTFQTMGQYRTALLYAIREAKENT